MSVSAVLLAAGRGSRMQSGINKVLLPLGDRPIIAYSLATLSGTTSVSELVIVADAKDIDSIRPWVPVTCPVQWVPGGRSRRDSSLSGARAASGDIVLIHDAARPFVRAALIERVLAAVTQSGAAIPALPVVDLLHVVSEDGFVRVEEDRNAEAAWIRAQTPQAFRRQLLLDCLERAPAGIRDDATAVLLAGRDVATVAGDPMNIKVTHPEDLTLARALAAEWNAGTDP